MNTPKDPPPLEKTSLWKRFKQWRTVRLHDRLAVMQREHPYGVIAALAGTASALVTGTVAYAPYAGQFVDITSRLTGMSATAMAASTAGVSGLLIGTMAATAAYIRNHMAGEYDRHRELMQNGQVMEGRVCDLKSGFLQQRQFNALAKRRDFHTKDRLTPDDVDSLKRYTRLWEGCNTDRLTAIKVLSTEDICALHDSVTSLNEKLGSIGRQMDDPCFTLQETSNRAFQPADLANSKTYQPCVQMNDRMELVRDLIANEKQAAPPPSVP